METRSFTLQGVSDSDLDVGESMLADELTGFRWFALILRRSEDKDLTLSNISILKWGSCRGGFNGISRCSDCTSRDEIPYFECPRLRTLAYFRYHLLRYRVWRGLVFSCASWNGHFADDSVTGRCNLRNWICWLFACCRTDCWLYRYDSGRSIGGYG